MLLLVLKAMVMLLQFELYLMRADFASLYEKVRCYPVRRVTPLPNTATQICSAVELACIWYWKEVLCLQRSATVTCLLRNRGVAAVFVIGAQQIPFRAHAWVEVNGKVINERSDVRTSYAVLDRA
jgi:hypothetical protein